MELLYLTDTLEAIKKRGGDRGGRKCAVEKS